MKASELAQIGLGKGDVNKVRKEVNDEMRRRFLHYRPYGPQLRFHNSKALERVMSGANQSGKTYAGSMETAFHLTGNYPDWWEGNRLEPVYDPNTDSYELNVWVVGTDNRTVRDNLMADIIGTREDKFTSGCLHPSYIEVDSRVMVAGTGGMVDNISIKHKSGCNAKLYFRSYAQGREYLQSASIHAVYCDEEPPEDIIGELKARLTATGGFMYMAFTPLSGMTRLVQEFWRGDDPNKMLVCMSIYESGHMTKEKLRMMESRYAALSESERKARMYGIPSIGTGMIYPIEDRDIYGEPPTPIPDHWKYLNGMDFGRGDHPNAVVFGVYDPTNDVIYLYDEEETVQKSVAENASLIRRRGSWVPVAWPHDLLKDTGVGAKNGSVSEGTRYKDHYVAEGITMCGVHAQTSDKSTRVEVGIIEVRRRLSDGRLKVSRRLSKWFDQKAIYRYGDDNKPIKKDDHLMDATRYLVIMIRYAITKLDILSDNNGEVEDGTDIWS